MSHFHRYRIFAPLLFALAVFLTGAGPAQAAKFDNPARDFLFGNHIDTHQQSKLKEKNGVPASLSGKLYIIFTGETDAASGLPVARHPRGSSHDEVCDVDVDCVAGWTFDAVPGAAKFLYHNGVNGDDHPVWMVNRVDIPQPGSFTHFHWIAADSTDPAASSVPPECDKDNAGQLEDTAPSAVNKTCDGWFLELRAVKSFAFEHGGEKIPVRAGIDTNTHTNLVTNYAEVGGITATSP